MLYRLIVFKKNLLQNYYNWPDIILINSVLLPILHISAKHFSLIWKDELMSYRSFNFCSFGLRYMVIPLTVGNTSSSYMTNKMCSKNAFWMPHANITVSNVVIFWKYILNKINLSKLDSLSIFLRNKNTSVQYNE